MKCLYCSYDFNKVKIYDGRIDYPIICTKCNGDQNITELEFDNFKNKLNMAVDLFTKQGYYISIITFGTQEYVSKYINKHPDEKDLISKLLLSKIYNIERGNFDFGFRIRTLQ